MSTKQKFRNEVEDFLAKFAMHHTTFGKLAVNDTAFVYRLRNGRPNKVDTIDKVREFMRTYKKPSGKPRPRKADNSVAA